MNSKFKYTLLLLSIFLTACNESSPIIQIACEENTVGNSIIRWEIAPAMKGQVKVYASNSPENISEERPIAAADIQDGTLTIITNDPTKRSYYSVVFNDKYRVKVATRNINVTGIQNVRDFGGYHSNKTGKNTRWGKIYRSAQIDSLCPYASRELRQIGIKTIIDLRAENEKHGGNTICNKFHVINIPIDYQQINEAIKDAKAGKVNLSTLTELINEGNHEIIRNYTHEIREVFNVLLNEDNYPIIISCSSGKGRTGLISTLILTTLEMDDETKLQDYLNSNRYYDITKASEYGFNLPIESQEAITSIYTAQERFFYGLQKKINSNHTNALNYLHNSIGLSSDDFEKLRHLLLE